jgi:hypothetical protein
MKISTTKRIAFLLAGTILLGAGCSRDVSPNMPESSTPPMEEEWLPDGVLKTSQGNVDRLRDVIVIKRDDGSVSSPLIIVGEARLWYFEGAFPISLLNESGKEFAHDLASADGDWMTEDWVPFTAEIPFPPQQSGSKGTIILRNDNPSGLPENDDRIEIPVTF